MRGENSITLRNMRCAPAPWHTKPTNSNENTRLDWILDLEGHEICHLPQTNQNFSPEQYRNTLALIQHAPQLLAALIEQSAAILHSGGKPNPNTLKLIVAAGGPDLTAAKQPAVQKPKKWNNSTQSLD